MINDLNYEGIKFLVSKKDISKIEGQNNICINLFCYENNLTYPVYVSDQKIENCLDLLQITYENKSHYVYISNILTDSCEIKQKIKIKNIFANVVYNVSVTKKF